MMTRSIHPVLVALTLGLALALSACARPLAAPDSPPETVNLYRGHGALAAGRPDATLNVDVIHREVGVDWAGWGATIPVAKLDLSRAAAKAIGPVYAFEVDGQTYINLDHEIPTRRAEYSPLRIYGERGYLESRSCHWISWSDGGETRGRMECYLDLDLIDLQTGERTPVDRKNLPAVIGDAPELVEAFQAERFRGMGKVRKYLVKWLERAPGSA